MSITAFLILISTPESRKLRVLHSVMSSVSLCVRWQKRISVYRLLRLQCPLERDLPNSATSFLTDFLMSESQKSTRSLLRRVFQRAECFLFLQFIQPFYSVVTMRLFTTVHFRIRSLCWLLTGLVLSVTTAKHITDFMTCRSCRAYLRLLYILRRLMMK